MIGVNTSIVSPTGASAGIGFAVPVDIMNRIVPELIRHGRVIRPAFGVNLWTDNITRQIGIKQGVMIRKVSDQSAAKKASLRGTIVMRDGAVRLGDIIIAVDDHSITDMNSLLDALERYEVGDTVNVTYIRNNKKNTTTIKLQPL